MGSPTAAFGSFQLFAAQTLSRYVLAIADGGFNRFLDQPPQLSTVVFTSAFESVKKQIEAVQKTAHT